MTSRDDILSMAKEADLWMTSDERIAAVERFAELIDERGKKRYAEGLAAWIANNRWHAARIRRLEQRLVNAHMLLVDAVGVIELVTKEDSSIDSKRSALEQLLSRFQDEIRNDWHSEGKGVPE